MRIYREGNATPTRFGADYVRENGKREVLTTGEISSKHAKDAVTWAVGCEWEPASVREDGFLDVGYAWVELPEAASGAT